VEFRVEGSAERLWGTLTNISLHGCHVEMNTTFPVGTKVNVVLKSFGIRIQAPGTVRAMSPFLCMGIGFAELEPNQLANLKQLLDTLSGRIAVSNSAVVEEYGIRDILASTDQRAFLEEIAKFFQKNQLLDRKEFHQIVKRFRRS
jgi:hypothetical protein